MPVIGATGNRTSSDHLPSTSYRQFYGQKAVSDPSMVNFSSHLGNPGRSGFTANNRPAIYYKPSLDHTDNPQMGLMLLDNFFSQTKRHYQSHIHPDGSGSLPNLLDKHRQSGFHQLRSHPKTAMLERKTVPQQTYRSVMKSDFLCPSALQGNDVTPNMCGSSCQESGYTRGAIPPWACDLPFILPSFKIKQAFPTKKTIGKKESTGFLSNAPKDETFPKTPFDRSHFTTHYDNMFCYHTGHEKLETGFTHGGVISPVKDYAYNRRDMDRLIFRG
ncbi:stabilizer of axonemal microtubules 4 [Halichoeres trimaculatus]|uniref:stabilizer of axonemal microtubules 4 n=1 Tax=Halichoeres trimaculatus TaxID=147232 RepID=UPI003D9DB896